MAETEGAVHLHFTEWCETPTPANNLPELADRSRTPSSWPASPPRDHQRGRPGRLVHVIDLCCDRVVRLVRLVLTDLPSHAALKATVTDGDRIDSRLRLLQRL